jgi:hypothetical protein
MEPAISTAQAIPIKHHSQALSFNLRLGKQCPAQLLTNR